MEPKFLISSHKSPPPVCALPFFPSFNSPVIQKPKSCSDFRLSLLPSEKLKRSPFLFGQKLIFRQNDESRAVLRTQFPIIRSGPVKRRKELPFDNVIQRDKKLKLALKIRKILTSHSDRAMPLRDLGRFREDLGLQEKGRRFTSLLEKFPSVFEIVGDGVYSGRFKLTPEAERLYFEEMKIRNQTEDLLVTKLRKLLMISIDKRILLKKISHLKTDFGLPSEFRDTICRRYPQYFKVVATGPGPALELTHWDPALAVSAAELSEEENRRREIDETDLIFDRAPKFNRVKLPKGLNVSKREMGRITRFRDMPRVSPYSDFSKLRSGTAEKEKHACGVIHEILSLTVEKRTLVDHLTHFREEFRFSQQLRGMLIRHPDTFYVSLKGDRDSVFLREAYRDSQLIDKDEMLLVKEKFRALVNDKRSDDSDETEENESRVDIENYDSDDGDDDEWSDDDDDDVPPGFSDKRYDALPSLELSEKRIEEVHVSSGRPRERW